MAKPFVEHRLVWTLMRSDDESERTENVRTIRRLGDDKPVIVGAVLRVMRDGVIEAKRRRLSREWIKYLEFQIEKARKGLDRHVIFSAYVDGVISEIWLDCELITVTARKKETA